MIIFAFYVTFLANKGSTARIGCFFFKRVEFLICICYNEHGDIDRIKF